MRAQAAGALLGLACGTGLVLVVAWVLARRRPGIAARIRPFVVGGPIPVQPPTVAALVGRMARRGPGATSGPEARTSDRLDRITWASVGGCVGGVIGLMIAGTAAAVAMALSGALAGVLLRGRQRMRQQRRQRELMEHQLPAAVELLAFSVSAGESAFGALSRTADSLTGALEKELGRAVADVRAGESLETALTGLGERSGSAPISAFVDALILGIERGTPLAEALRAQAADLQAAHRRRLVEQAGRKDVAMLVPVVFLVLPTVVAVALFPGLQGLRVVVP